MHLFYVFSANIRHSVQVAFILLPDNYYVFCEVFHVFENG